MIKTTAIIIFLTMTVSAHAIELKTCGMNVDFKVGKKECETINGADAESNGWNLVRRTDEKSWWLDSETETIWGPTHAYYRNGKVGNDTAVLYSFKASEKGCLLEGASLPTLEEYYYAFTWRYAYFIMNNSNESILGDKPVFWATSATFKNKAWWVVFNENGNLAKTPFTPLSKEGIPGDYRCVWRKSSF